MLYDSNYVTLWKKQNYGYGAKMSHCQRLRDREGRKGTA